MASKRYTLLVEVNEGSVWPDGSKRLVDALGGPLDDTDNSLLLEVAGNQLMRLGIDTLSVKRAPDSLVS